jgi:hypothetical protein
VKKTMSLVVFWSWIAVVTLGINLALAAERELNLSEPQMIAMIMGKYEGRWIDQVPPQLTVVMLPLP